MVFVLTKFRVNPDYRQEFKNYAVEKFGQRGLSQQEGFIKMNLLEPENFPPGKENNTFIIETVWEDMEALRRYTESEAFRKAHENLPPEEWFLSPPEVEVYRVIKSL